MAGRRVGVLGLFMLALCASLGVTGMGQSTRTASGPATSPATNASTRATTAPATYLEGKYFAVGIEQNGKMVPIKNHKIALAKKPFVIVVRLPKTNYVMLNVAWDNKLLVLARDGKEFPNGNDLDGKGMAEGDLNPDKELAIDPVAGQGYHYLSYTGTDENNRFDSVSKVDGVLVGRRSVERICEVGGEEGKSWEIGKLPSQSLYLVFVKTVTTGPTEAFNRQRNEPDQVEYLEIVLE